MAKGVKPLPKIMIPPKKWAEIIHDWKTGEYTQHQLADKYNVSYHTLVNRLSDLGVKKGQLIKECEASLTEKYRKAFLDRGFDENKVAEIVSQFLEAEKQDPNNKKKKVPDLYVRNIGLNQFAKFTGLDKQQEVVKEDKNVEVKILINNVDKEGSISTNLGDFKV